MGQMMGTGMGPLVHPGAALAPQRRSKGSGIFRQVMSKLWSGRKQRARAITGVPMASMVAAAGRSKVPLVATKSSRWGATRTRRLSTMHEADEENEEEDDDDEETKVTAGAGGPGGDDGNETDEEEGEEEGEEEEAGGGGGRATLVRRGSVADFLSRKTTKKKKGSGKDGAGTGGTGSSADEASRTITDANAPMETGYADGTETKSAAEAKPKTGDSSYMFRDRGWNFRSEVWSHVTAQHCLRCVFPRSLQWFLFIVSLLLSVPALCPCCCPCSPLRSTRRSSGSARRSASGCPARRSSSRSRSCT
jgi:hypothetical protein